jgi:hypothetical protein
MTIPTPNSQRAPGVFVGSPPPAPWPRGCAARASAALPGLLGLGPAPTRVFSAQKNG